MAPNLPPASDRIPANVATQPTTRSDPAAPAMKWADDSTGRPFAKDPSVIRWQDGYRLYFSRPPKPGATAWTIGIAASTDLTDWKTIAVLQPAAACEAKGLCAPGAIVLNGKVHLFYQTYGNGPADAVCHAVSDDGVTFRRDADNPVLYARGDWNCGRVIDAEAHVVGDQLFVYWATRDPAFKVQMLGVSSAPLSSDFGPAAWTQRCTQSILKPELPWEKNCIEAPTICERGGKLVMFYAGAYNNEPQQIGVAVSDDGLAWRRLSDQPFLPNGKPGEWNASESGHPGVCVDRDGTTWLFFQGNNDGGKTWFISKRRIEWDGWRPVLK